VGTVIEVLIPSNKLLQRGREIYLTKHRNSLKANTPDRDRPAASREHSVVVPRDD